MTELVIQKTADRSIYCRSISNQSMVLCEILEKSYCNKAMQPKAVVVPSGMAAISVVLNTLLMENFEQINLVYGDELYCDTPRLIKYLKKTYAFNEYQINVNRSDQIINLFDSEINNKTNILLVESCSNPSGDIFDFTMIHQLRKKSKNLFVIVDNTWLTHIIFNPFDYGVDIVVTSLTKYYSAGRCIAGAILAKKKLHSKLFDYVRINGLHVSPLHCEMVTSAMELMLERMAKSSATTRMIAELLASNNKISIRHGCLPSDPSYDRTIKFFKKSNGIIIYPSIISFTVPLKLDDAISWMKSIGINYETSYGSANSRFDPWPESIGESTICRLAIGYDEDQEKFLAELKNKISF